MVIGINIFQNDRVKINIRFLLQKNDRMQKRCVKGSTPGRSHKRITRVRSNAHVDKLRVRELRAERFYVLYAQCNEVLFLVCSIPKQDRWTDQW